MADDATENENEPVEWPITNELDLHAFRPSEVSSLLPEYFLECRKRGIFEVRVVHGKGTGALRVGVHRLLETMEEVADWHWPAGQGSGGWGATWVRLRR
ncbi:DNA mismatch repair protein MutS [Phragmitibacter flavus]|uniref:DNA mismatch repair protein MutS n=1 Tax=Phragmitibacter flavus TaxID=2576071 RepID=A0A5R8K836_9BACT|nr:Smr/MutS family protein [Phragmitibacter flavus]TLD68473.1 DNA mismatch repair protein MutS [Phragmitibacter flavus]